MQSARKQASLLHSVFDFLNSTGNQQTQHFPLLDEGAGVAYGEDSLEPS